MLDGIPFAYHARPITLKRRCQMVKRKLQREVISKGKGKKVRKEKKGLR